MEIASTADTDSSSSPYAAVEDSDSFSFARAHQDASPSPTYQADGAVQDKLIANEERRRAASELLAYGGMDKHRKMRICLKTTVVIVIIGLVTAMCLYFFLPHSSSPSCSDSSTTTCDLLCTGVVLQTIQFSGLFNDSKTFVDMPLNSDPQCIIDDFNSLQDYSKSSLYDFLVRNFEPSCSDMLLWSPPDYSDDPAFLKDVADPLISEWAYDIHSLWNLLGRQLHPDVYEHPERHTLLPLRSPHMIVPGGRFCEFYYWDSYWIIQGLLVSGMVETARGIVNNFIGLVQDFGFVPNGSRKYYLNRSQPPMLTLMVKEVFARTNDTEWLASILPTLEAEYQFWMEPGQRAVNITGSDDAVHVLNRYFTDSERPRPESYVADEMTAWLLYNMTRDERSTMHQQKHIEPLQFDQIKFNDINAARLYQSTGAFREGAHFRSAAAKKKASLEDDESVSAAHLPPSPVPNFSNDTRILTMFAQLAAAAESGWDFSSRWFRDRNNLTSVETMDLLPVDLNAILYAVEQQIGIFYQTLGETSKAAAYTKAAAARLTAIDAVLWNEALCQWQDYHIDRQEWKNEVMLSNFIPLWTKCYDKTVVDEASVISALLQSGLVLPGGLVTTLNDNTQQWDYPNAWAPLQWMVSQGIESSTYQSMNDLDSFRIYNSSSLPAGTTPPVNACDIAQPESWAVCGNSTDAVCTWCFPDGPALSQAFSLQWLASNFLAYNLTGYMLEKYYAPTMGSPGAGGEYALQKGFGWTNGVALFIVDKYANDTRLNLTRLIEQPYLFPDMAETIVAGSLMGQVRLPKNAANTRT